MKKYISIYEDRNGIIVSVAEFKADNIKEAKEIAQFHKRRTPEISQAKGVRVIVKRLAN